MTFSVIIPVYNAAPYLRACLDSVLAAAKTLEAKAEGEAEGEAKAKGEAEGEQWRDSVSVEVICVDDGSTDGSGALVDAYATTFNLQPPTFNLRVLHQQNAGVSAARNAGMAMATGDLVTFLDSDDTYDPRALEILADVWKKTGAEVIRYECRAVRDHAQDSVLDAWPASEEFDVNSESTSPLKRCALGAATAVSARLAKTIRWPDLSQCEDPLFVLRCLRQSNRNVFIKGPLINYLIRAESASHAASLPVITSTCRYLVMAYDECAAMPGFAKSRADTCAFLAGFLDGPLAKCGKDVSPSDRTAAEAAVRTARNLLAVRDPAFARFACRESHDFAFVLGSSCTATDVLRQAGLQYGSFPLDWVGRLDVGVRTDLIVSEFADFLSQERLALETDANDGCHARYVDSRYGTAFFHDFPAGVPLAESYPSVRAKYDRRIARFLRCLRDAKSVLVVWIADFRDDRDGIHATDAALSECLDRMEKKFPGTHFSMLVFDQSAAGEAPREAVVVDGRIRRVSVDDRDWAQGPESWALRMEPLFAYLSAHKVRDYRSSEERHAQRERERKAKYARLKATSWFDAVVADVQYRLFRHLQKRLLRKGVSLA